MSKYSKKEIKEMLRTGVVPMDAPSAVFRELERRRRKFNRESKSPEKEMDETMRKAGYSKIIPY